MRPPRLRPEHWSDLGVRVKRRASGRCWDSGSLRWLRQDLGLQLWLEQLKSQDLRLPLLSEGGAHAGMAHLPCHRAPCEEKRGCRCHASCAWRG
jgi:hypothetical protein